MRTMDLNAGRKQRELLSNDECSEINRLLGTVQERVTLAPDEVARGVCYTQYFKRGRCSWLTVIIQKKSHYVVYVDATLLVKECPTAFSEVMAIIAGAIQREFYGDLCVSASGEVFEKWCHYVGTYQDGVEQRLPYDRLNVAAWFNRGFFDP